MPIETKPWDVVDHLKTPEDVAEYIDAWLEDGTPEELCFALQSIARAMRRWMERD